MFGFYSRTNPPRSQLHTAPLELGSRSESIENPRIYVYHLNHETRPEGQKQGWRGRSATPRSQKRVVYSIFGIACISVAAAEQISTVSEPDRFPRGISLMNLAERGVSLLQKALIHLLPFLPLPTLLPLPVPFSYSAGNKFFLHLQPLSYKQACRCLNESLTTVPKKT
ncbi:hypothetical protein F4775DRAFT_561805 [Biscogniauxia sp. FL1348]|nr:hypothetical protein F4775DRAFT_561805 [Biscogniauxia sp. FL1348]